MEKSMKPSYEQGEPGTFSELLSISLGLSLFWACFFSFLLYKSFGDVAGATPAVPLPIALCMGLVVANLTIFARCDFFSRERGHRVLWTIVLVYSVAPGAVLVAEALGTAPIAAVLRFGAWFIAGAGLGCLLNLWSELLVGFVKGFASKALAFSTAIGALWFFILGSMPDVVGAAFLFLASPASLGLLRVIEKETMPAAYVSRAESVARHRLTKPIDALNTLYSAVFGLAISMLSRAEPTLWLYAGIALAICAGALLMVPFLGKNTDKMMHGRAQKFLFPILVIGLLPIPFVGQTLQVLCMLVLLAGFVSLSLVTLDSLFCLVKKYHVSPFYLMGRGHSPVIVGVAIGYLIGFVAESTGAVEDGLLAIVSLGLVVLLSVFVTVIPFDEDHLADEREGEAGEREAHVSDEQGIGPWKRRCAAVAKEHDLSAREIEVFNLLAKGRGTAYIQDKLYISPHTVKTHTYKIYRKMGINSREELLTLIENVDLQHGDRGEE